MTYAGKSYIFKPPLAKIGENLTNITKQLRTDEKVLWQGKPVLAPFVLAQNIFPFLIGLFFMAISLSFFILPMVSIGAPLESLLFTLIFFFIGFAFAFGMPIWAFLAFRNTEYLISDQRLITQTGAVGLDTRFVDLEKVQEVYVRIGVVDRLFGTGSIFAVTAGQVYVGWQQGPGGPGWGGSSIARPSLASLREPYEVQKLLQEAIREVKQTKS
jgi:uncharacterized membrane protein YdbT with pleckstrin-like domain